MKCSSVLITIILWMLAVSPTITSTFFPFKKPREIVIEKNDGTLIGCTLERLYTSREGKEQYQSTEPLLYFQLHTTPQHIPLALIRRVFFKGLQTLTFTSNLQTLFFSLGEGDTYLPEPPGWYKKEGIKLIWERCRLAKPSYKWYYIPSAAWVWSTTNWYEPRDETVLYRDDFTISDTFTVTKSILNITASDTIEKLYFNGTALVRVPIEIEGMLRSWDITHLVQKGQNVLGAKIRRHKEQEIAFSGMAFRVDVKGFEVPEVKSVTTPPCVRAVLKNGDVIHGTILDLDPPEVRLSTTYGKVAFDWDWIAHIRFNFPHEPAQKRKTLKRIIAQTPFKKDVLGPYDGLDADPAAWPVTSKDYRTEGVLLTSGEMMPGRLIEIQSGMLKIKPPLGKIASIPLYMVDTLFPTPRDSKKYLTYTSKDITSQCLVELINGDQLHGMLDRLTPTESIITPVYGGSIKIHPHDVVLLDFPVQPLIAVRSLIEKQGGVSRNIALIGGLRDQDSKVSDNVYFKVNRALFDVGLKATWLGPEQIVSRKILNTSNFSALINVDQNESYYHSVNSMNDAIKAIAQYKNSGGHVIQMAVGVPNFYGYIAHGGSWIRVQDAEGINTELSMKIASPVNNLPDGIPFELPENSNATLYFERSAESDHTITLPEQVDFPLIDDPRFRPLSSASASENAVIHPLYYLKDTRGKNYGIAAALIQYTTETPKPVFGFYAAYPLLNARHNSTSMIDYFIGYLFERIYSQK